LSEHGSDGLNRHAAQHHLLLSMICNTKFQLLLEIDNRREGRSDRAGAIQNQVRLFLFLLFFARSNQRLAWRSDKVGANVNQVRLYLFLFLLFFARSYRRLRKDRLLRPAWRPKGEFETSKRQHLPIWFPFAHCLQTPDRVQDAMKKVARRE